MLKHKLNGEHDHATVQCLEKGESQDKWQIKRTDSEASGVLTIFHKNGEYSGWDWDGCSSLVKYDGILLNLPQPTDAMQEILDIFADEY